jgi:hypothetical protein
VPPERPPHHDTTVDQSALTGEFCSWREGIGAGHPARLVVCPLSSSC